jgi:hypothetical protein
MFEGNETTIESGAVLFGKGTADCAAASGAQPHRRNATAQIALLIFLNMIFIRFLMEFVRTTRVRSKRPGRKSSVLSMFVA